MLHSIDSIFLEQGGLFCTPQQILEKKLRDIKCFVFDWDGVFNEGFSHEWGSPFSEIDSMGVNLLRFSYFLMTGTVLPVTIISGRKSRYARQLGKREHYNSIYYEALDKNVALDHLKTIHSLRESEIAFVFDDVLDIALAQRCGMRIFVDRKSNPLLKRYVLSHSSADYITSQNGGCHAVREACELCIGLQKNYDNTVNHRVTFSDTYRRYLAARGEINTIIYVMKGSQATVAPLGD